MRYRRMLRWVGWIARFFVAGAVSSKGGRKRDLCCSSYLIEAGC